MKQDPVAERVKKLQECLAQIKALLAWEQLKLQERRLDLPPAFRMPDNTDEDLRNQYSQFLAMATSTHLLLNDPHTVSLTQAQQAIWKEKLLKLEFQLKILGITERFIRF